MSVREVDALEWWEKRMYVEEYSAEIERENEAYGSEFDANAGADRNFDRRLEAVPDIPPSGTVPDGAREEGPREWMQKGIRGSPPSWAKKDKDSLEGIGSFGITTRQIPA